MRNQATLDKLADQLTSNCGDWLSAARTCGVSLQFVQQWMKDDPTTRELLQEAAQVGTQGLVSAAIQRAVHGVEKGVYYKGVKVDTELQYSDTLLTTLLKAKVEEFKQNDAAPAVTVNIANLMPRASNYEEWLAMKTSTAAAMLPSQMDNPVLPPDNSITEAEYEVIHVPFKGISL